VLLNPVQTLQRLVQTPSVNPMGRDVAGPHIGEARMTDLLVEICNGQGWHCSRQQVHPGRENLLIRIDGQPSPTQGGQLILWDVHQDTVPADGMTVEPFAGEMLNGRVYGRGACDVKGSLAAMLAALSRLAQHGPMTHPSIVLACTVNEECGFTGARELTRMWNDPCADGMFERPPDVAIVAEPTLMNVVVAHQGQVRWRCHTLGRAAHTSRPDAGVNAIYGMAKIVQAIARYHVGLTAHGPQHPLCGRSSVCVSTIHGGVAINTVPERATIEIDRRLAPGEEPAAAYETLTRYIAANADVGQCRVEHDAPFMQSIGLVDGQNRRLAECLAAVVRDNGRGSRLVGVSFGTDAAAISAAGVPTVVFGPGSIEQAHTADEFIAVDEIQFATEVFYRIACEGLTQ
jgi:acetylornithine deacetylase